MAAPNRVNLPDLPSELWLKIHQLAAFVPDLLNPDLVLDFSPTSRRTRRKLLRDSLVTKRYLVRVCKRWRSLALPLLYENLYIGRGRTLISLSKTLMLSKGKHHALGLWTKRIDVTMRDHIGASKKDRDIRRETGLLAEIFSCLPNLSIMHFDITAASYNCTTLEPALLDIIASTSGHCLRAFVWYTDSLVPKNSDWQSFLSRTPNIMTTQHPMMPFAINPTLHLGALNNISIAVDDAVGPPLVELPPFLPLHRLCTDASLSTVGIIPQAALLEKYGGGITVLQLGELTLRTLPSDLQLISRNCPNLTRLDISFYRWHRERDYDVSWSDLPETIEILGFHFPRGRQPKRVYRELLEGLCESETGKKLKIIQFTDEMNVRDLTERYYDALSGLAGELANFGLELHDHRGCSIY